MYASTLGWKTKKEFPKSEESKNAKLLIKAGFIDKVGAGIYSFLPLGTRVLSRIIEAVRKQMNAVDGAEILMPGLHPKDYWAQTERWETFKALFKLKSRYGPEFALGPTHEEIIVPLAKNLISSYKNLPLYLYQIQTKFRDEPRPKSGLLRGREFLMKDLYSFHTSAEDLQNYYEKVKKAYLQLAKVFELEAIVTEASGGTFSKYSHEFQVPCQTGEDTIFVCQSCKFARNKEIIKGTLKKCPKCQSKKIEKLLSIEIGNIFQLGTRFSQPFDLSFIDKKGKKNLVVIGCYGFGISRVLGALAEVKSDSNGLIWPKSVAPFLIYLTSLESKNQKINQKISQFTKEVYQYLLKNRVEVLFDNRPLSAGEKFFDSDLSGIPYRVVISEKTLKNKQVEVKDRKIRKIEIVNLANLVKKVK